MVATSDTLTIVFGLTATGLAGIAIWATRRYNNATRERNEVAVQESESHRDSDLELGLLNAAAHSRTTHASNIEASSNILQFPEEQFLNQRDNLHEVIGDALEVFSRHLRARR